MRSDAKFKFFLREIRMDIPAATADPVIFMH